MLRLTPSIHDGLPIDASAVVPDQLARLSLGEIARLPVHYGNREIHLSDLFQIEGDASDRHVEIRGDCARIKCLGSGMISGRLVVHGNVGMHLGAAMRGGRIDVFGNVDAWLGAEMRGGLIHVRGNAGDCAGSVYRGGTKGMRGGVILIDGDAGHEVGANLRRGLIAVGGTCGDFAGISMIAGTIVCHRIGRRPGAGMKRGSIIVLNGEVEPPPTFRLACAYRPLFIALYLRQLHEWGWGTPLGNSGKLFRRFSGDMLTLGKGEIFVAVPDDAECRC